MFTLLIVSLLGQVEEPVLYPRLPVRVTVQEVMFPVFVNWKRVGIIDSLDKGRGFPTGDGSTYRLPRGELRLYVRSLPRNFLGDRAMQEPEEFFLEVQYEVVGKYTSPWTAYAHELPALTDDDEVIIRCRHPIPVWHSAIVRVKEHAEYPILVTLLQPRLDIGMDKNSVNTVITAPHQIEFFEQHGYPNSMLCLARHGPKKCARELAEHFLSEVKKEKPDSLWWGRVSAHHIAINTVLVGRKPNAEYERMTVDELATAIEEGIQKILRQCPSEAPALKHELKRAEDFLKDLKPKEK